MVTTWVKAQEHNKYNVSKSKLSSVAWLELLMNCHDQRLPHELQAAAASSNNIYISAQQCMQ